MHLYFGISWPISAYVLFLNFFEILQTTVFNLPHKIWRIKTLNYSRNLFFPRLFKIKYFNQWESLINHFFFFKSNFNLNLINDQWNKFSVNVHKTFEFIFLSKNLIFCSFKYAFNFNITLLLLIKQKYFVYIDMLIVIFPLLMNFF